MQVTEWTATSIPAFFLSLQCGKKKRKENFQVHSMEYCYQCFGLYCFSCFFVLHKQGQEFCTVS